MVFAAYKGGNMEIKLDEFLAVCDDCDIADITVKSWPVHAKSCNSHNTRFVCCKPDVCVITECACGNMCEVYPKDVW